MKILFWNCKNNVKTCDVALLITHEDIDIAFFAEYDEILVNDLIQNLSYYVCGSRMVGCKKVSYIHKSEIGSYIIREQGRYCITKINKGDNDYLIGAVHMKDKYSSKDQVRENDCKLLGDDMREAEKIHGISDSIIIGDFNCNPWESAMTLKYGLNAVMFKKVIEKHKGVCVYDDATYEYYYNPMLNIISETKEIFGSIYNTTDVDTIYWNTFDQVLLRPSLIERLKRVDLIKEFEGRELLSKNGIPYEKEFSDHLPLIVEVQDKNE